MGKMRIRHKYALCALVALTVVAVVAGILRGSLMGVAFGVGTGIVLLFVLGIAWSRFRGEPVEHHAPSDKILDDTDP